MAQNHLNLGQKLQSSMSRYRKLEQHIALQGVFRWEHFRKGRLINFYETKNSITNAGRLLLLNVMFGATAKSASWYMGLISNSPTPTLAAGDTMASHAGWTELTNYSQATRPQWVTGAAAANAITNPAVITFNFTSGGTIYGAFIADQNTKGGTTGTLWSTVPHVTPVAVVADDEIRNSYTVTD